MSAGRGLVNLEKRVPFEAGNEAARRHGAQAQAWRLEPRAVEIADSLRPLVPGFVESDEVVLRLLALALTRLEIASLWLSERPSLFSNERKGTVWPVVHEMSKWEGQASRYLTQLGLTPASRSRIGAEQSGSAALAAYLESASVDEVAQ